MNNSTLDDHIKKQFSGYTPEVPPHIWQNILGARDKKRPGGFWLNFFSRSGWMLLVALLIGGGSVLFYYTYSDRRLATAAIPENVVPHKSNNSQGSGAQRINIKKDQAANRDENNNIERTILEKKVMPSLSPNTVNDKRIGNTKRAKTTARRTKPNTLSNERFNTHTNGRGYSNGKTNMTSTSPDQSTDEKTEKDADEVTSGNELLQPFYLNFSLLERKKQDAAITRITNPSLVIPCPKGERQPGKRYFEIYGGPDYAFRSMTDTGNSIYLAKRKESSHFTSAFSVGMRYTKIFGNGMSFRSGINYSQINEKFKYTEGNIIQVVYITNSSGDTTGSFTTSGTRYKNTFNKFRSLDVPLLVGYEIGSNKLRVNFNAGAIINIYSWQKGDVLDTAYKPVTITTGKGSSPYQFRTNTGIGFLGSVSVYYKLSEKLHLLAEPYFRYNLSPASKSELTLKQKYHTAGVRLGLRIDF